MNTLCNAFSISLNMNRAVCHCRPNVYFLFGLCFGVSVILLLSKIWETSCLTNLNTVSYQQEFSHIIRNELESDEYKPRINLAGKPQKALKTPQTLIRPRYYSTELGIREKLFVGVLSSYDTLNSYGVLLNKTLAHIVDKINFFIESTGLKKPNVSLPGIVSFTDTRKILKPFHMFKYITDNYLEEYDFFFIVKDTTFVKARTLYNLVESVSVSEVVHAGSEKVDPQGLYCSLDAGLLLSNSLVREIRNNLEWCVKNAFSDSDDYNLGRCILHATDISCNDLVQGKRLSTYILPLNFNPRDIQTVARSVEFESALTLYPVSQPALFNHLNAYFSKLLQLHAIREISELRHFIINTSSTTFGGHSAITWPIGNYPGTEPTTRFDVLRWDYFDEKHIFLNSDFSRKKELQGATKLAIEVILNSTISYIETKHQGQYQFQRLLNGYRRFDPSRGLNYKLDFELINVLNSKVVHKRIEVFEPLLKVEVVPMPYVTENTRVNMILPIATNDGAQALKFMEQYATVCMEKHDKTFLMLVLLYDPTVPGKGTKDDIFLNVKQMALSLSDQYKKYGNKIAWVSIKLSINSNYGKKEHSLMDFAVVDLVIKKLSPDSLIMMCQTNMEFRQDYLNRVRMNTILHWQVFSPLPFTEYYLNSMGPRNKELDINKNHGYYDTSFAKHISFYAMDYSKARNQVELDIPIIHTDRDVSKVFLKSAQNKSIYSIHDMFVSCSDLHVLRAVEPSLKIRYMEDYCSTFTSRDLNKCLEIRGENLGTRNQLAKIIFDSQINSL